MTIQIEVLSETATEVTAAFYYPVPPGQWLPSSVDPNRQPAGVRLSAQELLDLQDGRLYETIYSSIESTGSTVPQRRSKLVNAWATHRLTALQEYKNKYQSSGDWYDGTWNEG